MFIIVIEGYQRWIQGRGLGLPFFRPRWGPGAKNFVEISPPLSQERDDCRGYLKVWMYH